MPEQNTPAFSIDSTELQPLDVLQKDLQQAYQSFNFRIQELRASVDKATSRLMPVTPCTVADLFYEKPEINRDSKKTWSEQVIALRARLELERKKVEFQHEQNLPALKVNSEVAKAVIKLITDVGFPVDTDESLGIYADLKKYCPTDDSYELVSTVLETFESALPELRHSNHTQGVKVEETPRGNCFQLGSQSLREVHGTEGVRNPPDAEQYLPGEEALAPAPRVVAPINHLRPAPQMVTSPPGVSRVGGLPPANKSAAIRQPVIPVETARNQLTDRQPETASSRVPSWPTRPAPLPTQPVTSPPQSGVGSRIEPTLGESLEPAIVQATSPQPAAATPSVFRVMRPAEERSIPRDLKPQAAPAQESPEAAQLRRAQATLGRMQKIYGADRPDVLRIVEAMAVKHKYAEIAAWLSFCCEGRQEYLPRMAKALERFKPESNQDYAILEELNTAVSTVKNGEGNGFDALPFSPSLVHNLIPRSVQNDLREIAPLLVV